MRKRISVLAAALTLAVIAYAVSSRVRSTSHDRGVGARTLEHNAARAVRASGMSTVLQDSPLHAPGSDDAAHAGADTGHLLFERWRTETPDETWTTNMRRSLADLTEAAGVSGDVVHAVSCRSSLCRLELDFTDITSASALLDLTREKADQYRLVHEAVSSESDPPPRADATRYYVYASRDGVAMSDFENQKSRSSN